MRVAVMGVTFRGDSTTTGKQWEKKADKPVI
jgi:hypothetical protein